MKKIKKFTRIFFRDGRRGTGHDFSALSLPFPPPSSRLPRVRLPFYLTPCYSRDFVSAVLGSGWAKSEGRASPNFKLRDTTNDQSRQRRLRLHPRALHLHVCSSRIPSAIHPSMSESHRTWHVSSRNVI